ncbi:SCO family protein [Xanthomonas sp. NCPPB 2654]|uniref:SCO family protein n=1 Tax=unclassified Xanthomonas TaxID=2643310 RepID=UPI0021E0337A|nr:MULTISPECIES: SCO family protein [unclassified Xanthomonas]MDL5365394.1 SCO family protein [Xanthomonas sp. NCPPB 2654]UYC20156.1 SCO family protein [Xanthomonas sp. CFBP 8443]
MNTSTFALFQSRDGGPTRHRARHAAFLLLALLLCGCSRPPLHGADLSAAGRGVSFYLTDTQGVPRPLQSFRGKALVLFFGFTRCPDVCPTTLVRATQIKRQLGEDARHVQFAFATLDPERDTPKVLRTYVQAFDPDFVGLTGTESEIKIATAQLNVAYTKVPIGNTYTIDHSTRSYVFDAAGDLRVGLAHKQSVEECVEDIRQVLAYD